jgi:hypothetical protein
MVISSWRYWMLHKHTHLFVKSNQIKSIECWEGKSRDRQGGTARRHMDREDEEEEAVIWGFGNF